MADQNKSEAIRRVLEAVPEIRPAHAQAILARKGIDITPDLFRVVKMNWLRDRREEEESERRYKEYWSPEAVSRRAEERARQIEQRRQAEEEEGLQVRSMSGPPAPPAPRRSGVPLPPGMVYDDLTNKIVPAPLTDEIRRLTAERKHDLVARVVQSFSDDEWSEIVAEYRDAERSVAEDLAQDYSYGLTEEEAVARVVAGLRRRPASAGDDAFHDRDNDFDEDM